MQNIWSENKYINGTINIMLFLLGINFVHFGQLFLPIICLLIFIDNKYIIKVNNVKTFVILCLFSITFFIFSFKQGIYSVMGFCLPMAYYIGSNIKEKNDKNIKKIVYLLIFSTSIHMFVNAIYDTVFMHYLRDKMTSTSHYDIWTGNKLSSTIIAIDFDLLIGAIYYIIRYEEKKIFKIIFSTIFAVCFMFCIFMCRRTQIYLFAICAVILFIYDILIYSKRKLYKTEKLIILLILLFILLFIIFYTFNVFDFKTYMDKPGLFEKIKQKITDDYRVSILFDSFALMPKYILGGNKISSILGIQIHNLWMDIYDFAGIIPFILFILYSYYVLKVIINNINHQNNRYIFLKLGLFICVFMQMLLEPIMTGDSLFLIISVIIGALYEK